INLRVAGMNVFEAATGEEAIELARRERPDVVLLDVMMPGLDGWEVAEQLANEAETREIPIVFLTARAAAEDRRRGHAAGGVGYVVKPFDPLSLASYLDDVVA